MKQRPRLIWQETRPSGLEAVPAAAPRFAFIPTVVDAASPREDAIGLLQVAAEIEHALLVQYLYAAASVATTTGAPPPNIRGKITSVAVQEMGHLVTVQNLLLAIGGRENHHFGRDLLREQSQLNPIPFILEPLSHTAAAQYVIVERPETIADQALRTRVESLEQEVLLATGFDPKRVGELYAAIYWLMQPSDAPFGQLTLSVNEQFRAGWHVGAGDFFPADDIRRYATIIDEWHGYPDLIADVVIDADSACQALYSVMAQGEGIAAKPDAHFEEFLEVLDAFDAGQIQIAPMPRSPYVAGQRVPADPRAVELTHAYTKPWAQLFNEIYTHVILCLGHALSLPLGDPVRDEVRESAIQGMRPAILALMKQLQRLRVNDTGAALAGPTFGLLTEDLPETAAAFWAAHRDRLTREDAFIAEIQAHPDHAADQPGKTALRVVGQLQTRLKAVLPEPTEGAVAYAIFPPIGIARIGNSDTDFYIARERRGSLGSELLANGTEQEVTSFKDAQFRMKRQAARFRILQIAADGSSAPAQLPAGARIRWTARLVNKKDAIVRPGSPPDVATRPVLAAGRGDRVIDSGAVAAPGPLRGTYAGQAVDLGELRLNGPEQLLVLGGHGRSASPAGAAIGRSFYNNPDWFDDLADGPVQADIDMPDGTVQPVAPAWVIVAPPDFAPGCGGVVTLYDVMLQVALDRGDASVPARPRFWQDIQPMLERAANLRWVDNGASWPLVNTDWNKLSDPSPAAAALRQENAGYVRDAEVLLHDFTLRRWQTQMLAQYEAGNFDPAPLTVIDPGQEITRAALDGTVGQGFFPGIEAGTIVTDPALYARPFAFRFDAAQLSAGDATALMALPWQADFLKCGSGWWPAQRPNVAPQANGARPPWLRPNMNHAGLVQNVMRLGVITPAGGGAHAEAGRDPTL